MRLAEKHGLYGCRAWPGHARTARMADACVLDNVFMAYLCSVSAIYNARFGGR
jgi:hypothetical protein